MTVDSTIYVNVSIGILIKAIFTLVNRPFQKGFLK
jgi:hypothetical protein